MYLLFTPPMARFGRVNMQIHLNCVSLYFFLFLEKSIDLISNIGDTIA